MASNSQEIFFEGDASFNDEFIRAEKPGTLRQAASCRWGSKPKREA